MVLHFLNEGITPDCTTFERQETEFKLLSVNPKTFERQETEFKLLSVNPKSMLFLLYYTANYLSS
jgi:hypothetical protein